MAARAREHFDTLHGEIAAYVKDNPIRVDRSTDPDSGDEILKLPEPPVLPREWAGTLGDAIGNCSKALNYMVIAFVRKGGGEVDRQVEFPIGQIREDYFRVSRGVTYRDRKLKGVPEAVAKKIDDLQPWQWRSGKNRDRLGVLKTLRDAAEHHELQAGYLSIDAPAHTVMLPIDELKGEVTITISKDGERIGVEADLSGGGLRPQGIAVRPNMQMQEFGVEPVFGSAAGDLATLDQIKTSISWVGEIVKWFRPDFEAD